MLFGHGTFSIYTQSLKLYSQYMAQTSKKVSLDTIGFVSLVISSIVIMVWAIAWVTLNNLHHDANFLGKPNITPHIGCEGRRDPLYDSNRIGENLCAFKLEAEDIITGTITSTHMQTGISTSRALTDVVTQQGKERALTCGEAPLVSGAIKEFSNFVFTSDVPQKGSIVLVGNDGSKTVYYYIIENKRWVADDVLCQGETATIQGREVSL